ncbi:hypothetical protein L596_012915 [Steinernema carpocapsae]|uniref:Uncharacterized protein n=1 Tax=Steinernema carpocapsae TaxID=34508 RepID=A0A4U5NZH5_STECR|nr:hypothetical protein L596_012915 [Steinernema carpocapsae]
MESLRNGRTQSNYNVVRLSWLSWGLFQKFFQNIINLTIYMETLTAHFFTKVALYRYTASTSSKYAIKNPSRGCGSKLMREVRVPRFYTFGFQVVATPNMSP